MRWHAATSSTVPGTASSATASIAGLSDDIARSWRRARQLRRRPRPAALLAPPHGVGARLPARARRHLPHRAPHPRGVRCAARLVTADPLVLRRRGLHAVHRRQPPHYRAGRRDQLLPGRELARGVGRDERPRHGAGRAGDRSRSSPPSTSSRRGRPGVARRHRSWRPARRAPRPDRPDRPVGCPRQRADARRGARHRALDPGAAPGRPGSSGTRSWGMPSATPLARETCSSRWTAAAACSPPMTPRGAGFRSRGWRSLSPSGSSSSRRSARRRSDGELAVDWPGAARQREAHRVAGPLRPGRRRRGGPRARRCLGESAPCRPDDRLLHGRRPLRLRPRAGRVGALRDAVALARMASRNELPVVLFGESGTGKELFAQAIHSASVRGDGPFIAVNCGCIPAALLEAELFGYESGTFTGGRKEGSRQVRGGRRRDPLPRRGERALSAGADRAPARPAGARGGPARRQLPTQGRHPRGRRQQQEPHRRDPGGPLPPDLYFRLNVLAIAIPPLRDRRADIPLSRARSCARPRRSSAAPASASRRRRSARSRPTPGPATSASCTSSCCGPRRRRPLRSSPRRTSRRKSGPRAHPRSPLRNRGCLPPLGRRRQPRTRTARSSCARSRPPPGTSPAPHRRSRPRA